MFGNFQKSQLRIEIEAPAEKIRESLLNPVKLDKWLPWNVLNNSSVNQLHPGSGFTTELGFVCVHHQVDVAGDNYLRLLLSQGIDGFHEWYWGEGWVQSRLEGVSMLPMYLGQTLTLLNLRQFLARTGD